MLIIKGVGRREGVVAAPRAAVATYVRDIEPFLWKISDVEQVKPLAEPDCYLLTFKPIGTLNYFVTLVYAVHVEDRGQDGLGFLPLDFDLSTIKAKQQPVKGMIRGHVKLNDHADGTHVAFENALTIEYPMPFALKLMPRPMVQAAADGIMSHKITVSTDALYQKVATDFKLAPTA